MLDETSVKWKPMLFYVCEADGPNILGLKACTPLGLVKLNCKVNTDKESHKAGFNSISDLQKEYPEQFDGIGNFPGRFHITIKDDVIPVVHAKRKYPVH